MFSLICDGTRWDVWWISAIYIGPLQWQHAFQISVIVIIVIVIIIIIIVISVINSGCHHHLPSLPCKASCSHQSPYHCNHRILTCYDIDVWNVLRAQIYGLRIRLKRLAEHFFLCLGPAQPVEPDYVETSLLDLLNIVAVSTLLSIRSLSSSPSTSPPSPSPHDDDGNLYAKFNKKRNEEATGFIF